MSNIETKTNILLSTLTTIMILLMLAIAGLFIRMNQLQNNIVALLSSQGLGGQEIGLPVGSQAPDLTLTDVNGETITLRDFRGDWVLLGFSSITCPVCDTMYPHLRAFSESRDNLQIVLVSKGSTEENQEMVRQQGFLFPVLTLRDEDVEIVEEYQVPGTPFFYLIDQEGIIQSVGFVNTREHLQQLVDGSTK